MRSRLCLWLHGRRTHAIVTKRQIVRMKDKLLLPIKQMRIFYGKWIAQGVIRPMLINPGLEMNEPCCNGIWLPEEPPLFRPFIADPRQVTYSVGWRFNDNAATKNVIDVSFGDTFAIYRWCDVGPWHGELQIDLEGALWAIFDPCYESAPLLMQIIM